MIRSTHNTLYSYKSRSVEGIEAAYIPLSVNAGRKYLSRFNVLAGEHANQVIRNSNLIFGAPHLLNHIVYKINVISFILIMFSNFFS